MTIRKILVEPNQFLRKKSLLVEKVDDEARKIMDDMLETMYAAPGIGLAAIQIGITKRIIVLDLGGKQDEPKNPMFFVNPEIIEKSNTNSTYEEGCLSVPGQFAEIDRPEKCHLKYLDYYGTQKEIRAEGMLATCIQHEMDHLEGILFIDYLSKLKRSMITKKLSKQKKELERIVV
jgi:peptide deformylase